VYSMVHRREKKKDSRYIQEASAPAAVTMYQTCNIMYICNNKYYDMYRRTVCIDLRYRRKA
jgi:hypothetical protein